MRRSEFSCGFNTTIQTHQQVTCSQLTCTWSGISPVDALMNRRIAGTSLGIMGWNYFLFSWRMVQRVLKRQGQSGCMVACTTWTQSASLRFYGNARITWQYCLSSLSPSWTNQLLPVCKHIPGIINSEAFACLRHDVSMAPCWLLNGTESTVKYSQYYISPPFMEFRIL